MDLVVLFHTTYYGRLAGIAEHGLVVGAGRSIGSAAYDFHAKKGVFLSDADGVSFWFNRAEAFAEHNSDNVLEDGLVPVVLRVLVNPVELVPDEVANRENRVADNNWISPKTIYPEDIEVWSGTEWLSIDDWSDIDPESALEFEESDDEKDDEGDEDDEGYEDDLEDGGYWLFLTDSPLQPDDEALARDWG